MLLRAARVVSVFAFFCLPAPAQTLYAQSLQTALATPGIEIYLLDLRTHETAMYLRSCGGHTRTSADAPPDAYPFYSASCDYCLRHPELWTRPHTPATQTERQRLAYNRAHGWSAIPSNTTALNGSTLEGRGTGHGLGLCQLGASDLAERGATFARILARYYPNTSLAARR